MEDMEEFINNMEEICRHDARMPARLVRNLIKNNLKDRFYAECINYPTRIVKMQNKPKSHNKVEMYLDNGWQLDFVIQERQRNGYRYTAAIVGAPPETFSLAIDK